jgi:AhpD family alkylhydroperoxidase
MKMEQFNQSRKLLNKLMSDNDDFFATFGQLDDAVYSENIIPKKYKELTGLSISILTRCEECILYHIQGCLAEKANKQEIIEAIKIGVIGGGSITYPSARLAFKTLKELKVID